MASDTGPTAAQPKGQINHLLGVDLVRFIAALLVMVSHLGYTTWAMNRPTDQSRLLNLPNVSTPAFSDWAWFGWIGVEVFFVVSGFVIAFSAENSSARKFAISRTARLYPEAWIAAIIGYACIVFILGDPAHWVLPFIRSITLWPFGPWLDSVLWTLGVEMAFYFLMFLVLLFGQIKNISIVLIVLGLYSSAWWLTLFMLDQATSVRIISSSRLFNLALLGHGCYFALGGLMYLSVKGRLVGFSRIFLGVFFAACCLEITVSLPTKLPVGMPLGGPQSNAWTPIAVWAVLVFAIYASALWSRAFQAFVGKGTKYFRLCGLMTYPIYLIHSTFGILVMRYLYLAGVNIYVSIFLAMFSVGVLSMYLAKVSDLGRKKLMQHLEARRPIGLKHIKAEPLA